MTYRYREILEGDNPDKGSYKGSCNRRQCMLPFSAEYYNSATDSYYCADCACAINEANFASAGFQPLCTFDEDGSKCEKDYKDPFKDDLNTFVLKYGGQKDFMATYTHDHIACIDPQDSSQQHAKQKRTKRVQNRYGSPYGGKR